MYTNTSADTGVAVATGKASTTTGAHPVHTRIRICAPVRILGHALDPSRVTVFMCHTTSAHARTHGTESRTMATTAGAV